MNRPLSSHSSQRSSRVALGVAAIAACLAAVAAPAADAPQWDFMPAGPIVPATAPWPAPKVRNLQQELFDPPQGDFGQEMHRVIERHRILIDEIERLKQEQRGERQRGPLRRVIDPFPARIRIVPANPRDILRGDFELNIEGRDAWLSTILRTRDVDTARAEARKRLVQRLDRYQVAADLTADQRLKLQLAGWGDIDRFLAECETVVSSATRSELSPDDVRKHYAICLELRAKLQTDLHGPQSLLHKTLHSHLSADQLQRLQPLISFQRRPKPDALNDLMGAGVWNAR